MSEHDHDDQEAPDLPEQVPDEVGEEQEEPAPDLTDDDIYDEPDEEESDDDETLEDVDEDQADG